MFNFLIQENNRKLLTYFLILIPLLPFISVSEMEVAHGKKNSGYRFIL